MRRGRGTRPTWVRVPHLPLHKALLSKAEEISAADDHVVDDFHVNEFQAADHPLRDQLVRLALVTDHRRMLGFVPECHLAILASRLVLTSA